MDLAGSLTVYTSGRHRQPSAYGTHAKPTGLRGGGAVPKGKAMGILGSVLFPPVHCLSVFGELFECLGDDLDIRAYAARPAVLP